MHFIFEMEIEVEVEAKAKVDERGMLRRVGTVVVVPNHSIAARVSEVHVCKSTHATSTGVRAASISATTSSGGKVSSIVFASPLDLLLVSYAMVSFKFDAYGA